MGLPMTVTTAVNEMMSAACLSLQLTPLMTQGQIEALEHHASDEIKALYLPKLISRRMVRHDEPDRAAGGLGRRCAAHQGRTERRRHLRDHRAEDLHLAGATTISPTTSAIWCWRGCRTRVAGTKGISLFLVPKFLPDADGNPGEANSLKVVSLEHKMGLHGSPTAVMQYDGATGWMIGSRMAAWRRCSP